MVNESFDLVFDRIFLIKEAYFCSVKFRFIIFICIIGLCPQSVGAQSNDDKSEGQVVFDMINEANAMVNTEPTKASELIQEALKKAISTENLRAQGYCYNTLGAIDYKLNSYVLSATNYKKSIELFETVVDPKGKYNSLKYIGHAYEAAGDLETAQRYYLILLELAQNTGQKSDYLKTLYDLGRVSYNSDIQGRAKVYFNEALKLEEAAGNESGIAKLKIWIGMVEEKLGNDEQAINNYEQSNKIALQNGYDEVYQQSSNSIGNYLNSNSRNSEAVEIQKKAQKQNILRGNRSGELDNVYNIAKYQLDDNNPEEAIPYIKNSIDISKELGNIELLTDANLMLSKAYEQQGNYDSALVEYKKYLSLVDSVENLQAKRELVALKMSKQLNEKVKELESIKRELSSTLEASESMSEEFESIKEERALEKREREELEAGAERNRMVMIMLSILMLGAGISAFLIYRSAKAKRRANQLLALKSLRSQMNPHFIFNSLNSVNSFIARNDERSANKYLSEFSRLMRAVMENSKHDLVPLSSELDILKMYLDLEHVRFKDKFDFSFEIDDDLEAETVEIPPMLIQPYIENAIWHGLRYKEEKGFLSVKFVRENNQILAVIEDNGIGRHKSQELKTHNQKQTVSTGMKNIEGRLNILNDIHNTNLDVLVEDLFENGQPAGTKVKVKIPFNINKEAA